MFNTELLQVILVLGYIFLTTIVLIVISVILFNLGMGKYLHNRMVENDSTLIK